jgi:REP element-mobilizing transposase RayT
MARRIVPISTEFPYHVSARCNNREWFRIPLKDVWAIMEDYLIFVHRNYDFEILSFVLMANHFHLLVRTPEGNLSEGMNYFMRETSRQIGYESKRINHIYKGRFHRSLITNPHYFLHAYKYVYRNPVEVGIVDCVTKYPYSTLNRKLGLNPSYIPLVEDDTLWGSFESTLEWLNTTPLREHFETVRKALRRKEFSLGKTKNRSPHTLERNRY